jgi:hypothetical protein
MCCSHLAPYGGLPAFATPDFFAGTHTRGGMSPYTTLQWEVLTKTSPDDLDKIV